MAGERVFGIGGLVESTDDMRMQICILLWCCQTVLMLLEGKWFGDGVELYQVVSVFAVLFCSFLSCCNGLLWIYMGSDHLSCLQLM